MEFDEPYELLQKKSSKFSELVKEVGGEASGKLYEMARKARHRRLKGSDSVFGSQYSRSNSHRNPTDQRKDNSPSRTSDNGNTMNANGTVEPIAENNNHVA